MCVPAACALNVKQLQARSCCMQSYEGLKQGARPFFLNLLPPVCVTKPFQKPQGVKHILTSPGFKPQHSSSPPLREAKNNLAMMTTYTCETLAYCPENPKILRARLLAYGNPGQSVHRRKLVTSPVQKDLQGLLSRMSD